MEVFSRWKKKYFCFWKYNIYEYYSFIWVDFFLWKYLLVVLDTVLQSQLREAIEKNQF